MSYSNQKCLLITDSLNNIHYFYLRNDEIIRVMYNTENNNIKDTIVENARDEYDITIDENDKIYLICQKKDNSIALYLHEDEEFSENILAQEFSSIIYNLNIKVVNDKVHIFYSVPGDNDSNLYRIYHHYLHDNKWNTIEVCDVRKGMVLNPFVVFKHNDELLIAYYDLVENIEQIFIKKYDTKEAKWGEGLQITDSVNNKLYLDFIKDDSNLHLTYSEYIDGNYIIKYRKVLLEDGIITNLEKSLSNPCNASNPTLIKYNNKIWVSWTEYAYLASAYSDDMGDSWSNPYMWNESKSEDFIIYKYETNKNTKNILNYSFGKVPPKFTFLGFGDLKNAEEIPILNKIKENIIKEEVVLKSEDIIIEEADIKSTEIIEEEIVVNDYDLEKEIDEITDEVESNDIIEDDMEITKKDIEALNEKIEELENRIKKLENRVFRKRPFSR